MSLNGLEDAKVKEAHEAAVAEAGGWYVQMTPRTVTSGRARRFFPLRASHYKPALSERVHTVQLLILGIISSHRFLLKYASRDEVEVLARGSNGVVEMRSNIEQYEETSPLFGFLRYRRRNVLLKYMPEGCSRLIQGWSLKYAPSSSAAAWQSALDTPWLLIA